MFKRIVKLKESSGHISVDLAARQKSILEKKGSKFAMYVKLNPTLATHRLYTDRHTIPDKLRIVFTRFRTSSHRLRVELGRWSRVPAELRTCPCGSGDVQNEEHVFACQRTAEVRRRATFEGGCEDFFRETSLRELIMLKDCLSILED